MSPAGEGQARPQRASVIARAPSARGLALTLAGGGNRAFYQMGLLSGWWTRIDDRVGVMSTCSAGACIAVLLLSGRGPETLDYWLRRRARVTRNFQWSRLLAGRRPTPHFPIYRDTMLHALADGGLERVKAQPFPIRVVVAAPPYGLPIALAVPIGLGAYSLERWWRPGRLHPGLGRRLGFTPIVLDLRDAPTADAAADLVLASSATPPFTPVGHIGTLAVLDGGVVDNAPAFAAELDRAWERHLVLLTRPYPAESVGHQGRRWYVCPSRPVPADRWDYTRPERISATIALGERDAARRLGELERWLDGGPGPDGFRRTD